MVDQILIGVLGNLAMEPVRNALRSLLPARRHDLEPAVVAAFTAATGELARQAHREDERRIWEQVRDDAERLVGSATSASNSILDALILGNAAVLRGALEPPIATYAARETEDVRRRLRVVAESQKTREDTAVVVHESEARIIRELRPEPEQRSKQKGAERRVRPRPDARREGPTPGQPSQERRRRGSPRGDHSSA
jgi:hypothetical protein